MRRLLPLACSLFLAAALPARAEPVTFSIVAPDAREVCLDGLIHRAGSGLS